jgi:pyruvate,orthophosphate dikinase
MAGKYVWMFEEGDAKKKPLLGGKGANLAEMTRMGLPVPPGFIITTEVCRVFTEHGKYPAGLEKEMDSALKKLEKKTGKAFGDARNPLLVSVRSGAPVSMPGMMDTVLNLGLNDKTVEAVASKTKNSRFACDSYRRLLQMFGDVVLGVEHASFEKTLEKHKKAAGVELDKDLDGSALKAIIKDYEAIIRKETGKPFPQDPREQLRLAIGAVFKSWNNKRAITYRRLNHIPDDIGTAVNVQSMAFGNTGNNSGTGVGFTRNPSTGQKEHYGEYLINAQGEDVVAGIRTPQHIDRLKKDIPRAYEELLKVYGKLEKHYKDMQDFEFTIEDGKLYILQTRNGKRTAQAAVRIAVEMVREGLITKREAVMRVDPDQLNQLLHKQLDPVAKSEADALTKGLPASPGAAVGEVVFSADKAKALAEEGRKVVLVRTETSPEDIEGMHAAQGILTARGGMTSHAAVVARGMGKCCVAGASEAVVDEAKGTLAIKGVVLREGDHITLDGNTGEVYKGRLRVVDPELSGNFAILMGWADAFRKLKVKTNADTPHDAEVARKFGAEGIGLCRTEHMFFEGDRITAVREMILAEDLKGRKKALAKLLPMQKQDFKGIFKAMDGLPVIIRLLDPPLHEFLPKEREDIGTVAKEMGVSPEKIEAKVQAMHEFNPMLGFRGCRLGVAYPEITEMQARAILEAAMECRKEGIKVMPQIEVPLVGNVKEFTLMRDIIKKTAREMGTEGNIKYEIGTMIEVPRAAITADRIAMEADFMSFGTNDLTQMGCGFSRDDAGNFLKKYVEVGVYSRDPFQAIDREGVGELMKICVRKARSVKPNIEIGICGEHGGEPSSVEFCHMIGMNDVSCSPFRIPIARLAAAQAAIRHGKG